jgi:Ca-activated chloride channel family protein
MKTWLPVIALALAIAFAGAAPAQQRFRVGTEGVQVDVLVTENNRPVAGLTVSDFELRDSGIPQRVESVAFEDVPLSLMLALDTSGSVDGQPLEHLKQAALAVVHLLRPGDRAALLTFNSYVSLQTAWTSDTGRLEAAIQGTKAWGGTALYDAAYSALTLRDTQPGRTLALLFSDGDDTTSWEPGQAVIDIANRNDVVVYAVELRPESWTPGYGVDFSSGLQTGLPKTNDLALNGRFLNALSKETGGQHLDAARSDGLRDAFVRIVNEFRTRYLLTYTPQGVDAHGWHPIAVTLKSKRGKVTARRGYLR